MKKKVSSLGSSLSSSETIWSLWQGRTLLISHHNRFGKVSLTSALKLLIQFITNLAPINRAKPNKKDCVVSMKLTKKKWRGKSLRQSGVLTSNSRGRSSYRKRRSKETQFKCKTDRDRWIKIIIWRKSSLRGNDNRIISKEDQGTHVSAGTVTSRMTYTGGERKLQSRLSLVGWKCRLREETSLTKKWKP